MSVFAALHIQTAPGSLRTAPAGVVGHLAASPLDSPALHAVAARAPARPPVRMRARWQAVTAADGATRLEATWHPDH